VLQTCDRYNQHEIVEKYYHDYANYVK